MRSNRTRHHALCTAVAMAASMLAADISLAQQGIEEIVVTARKREENLQDVPMAISAFTAEQLQNSQVDNITDLQKMTPNITVNETSGLVAGVVQVFIRGIGNDPGFDQGVGIYVDDVYLNTATGALLEVYAAGQSLWAQHDRRRHQIREPGTEQRIGGGPRGSARY